LGVALTQNSCKTKACYYCVFFEQALWPSQTTLRSQRRAHKKGKLNLKAPRSDPIRSPSVWFGMTNWGWTFGPCKVQCAVRIWYLYLSIFIHVGPLYLLAVTLTLTVTVAPLFCGVDTEDTGNASRGKRSRSSNP